MFLLMYGGFLAPTSRSIILALATGVPETAQNDQYSFLVLVLLTRLYCNISATRQEKYQRVNK